MGKASSPQFKLVVGRLYDMVGDVTTLASITGLTTWALELRLGFAVGRLKEGYGLLLMVEKVAIDDFIWGDQTRYSGRYQFRRDVGEYVERIDLYRAWLAKKYDGDEDRINAEYYNFLGRQQNRLNVRSGTERIVKIFPVVPHNPALGWEEQYPNAPVGGVPQWTISRAKKMKCVANVLRGAVYHGRD